MKWVQFYGNLSIFDTGFLWDWRKNWPFQSCGHCCIFQIWWYIEPSTFTASSFRIWNGSAGIPLPPLIFYVVIFPKAHLTSQARMPDSGWVTTPSWLSLSLRPFLQSSSVYSYNLFLISFASVKSLLLLSFIMPILAWNVPLISPVFLRRSLVFPVLLFSSISFLFFKFKFIYFN